MQMAMVLAVLFNSKYNRVFYCRDESYFVCTQSAGAGDRHHKILVADTGTRYADKVLVADTGTRLRLGLYLATAYRSQPVSTKKQCHMHFIVR